MKNYGWDVYGVEVDELTSKVAESKGLKVFKGYLEDAQFPSGHFDAVIMNHVLEHIHSPGKILDECRRILKPGGRLILGVPNFGCYDQELFGSCWFAMEVPRHLFHFTQDTLSALLENHGFHVERWRRRFPHPLYAFLSFSYYKELHHPGVIESLALLVRALVVKPTRWFFSAHREYYDEILEVYTQKR
jgi:SAM-dependent methyltransferase